MVANGSQHLLEEVNRLETLRVPDREADRPRRYRRFVIRGDAELHPMSRTRLDSTPIEIKLRDIGRGGIGFLCASPLPIDSSWRVCFLQHGYAVGVQAMVVRHCREVSQGVYLIGGQFVIDNGLLAVIGADADALRDEGQPTDRAQAPDDGDGSVEGP